MANTIERSRNVVEINPIMGIHDHTGGFKLPQNAYSAAVGAAAPLCTRQKH